MNNYPGGVWPVMLTPFTENNQIDEEGLHRLVNWYIDSGVSGLFAACQSSEIMKLSLEERVKIVKITQEAAAGRVPIVASGHISDEMEDQVCELSAIAETGVDAVITITNHLAREDEDDDVWMRNMETLVSRLDPAINLGMYECPAPYKRLMSIRNLKLCADTGRFYFMKDTCCDADMVIERVKAIEGTNLKLYNANATCLLETMRAGAAGFSGVMANIHPELYVWLTANIHHPNADMVQAALSLGSLIERQLYPTNAKYHLKEIEKLGTTTRSRVQDDSLMNPTFKLEVKYMDMVMNDIYERYCK